MNTDELILEMANAHLDGRAVHSQIGKEVAARLRAADALAAAVSKKPLIGYKDIKQAAEAYRKACEGGRK